MCHCDTIFLKKIMNVEFHRQISISSLLFWFGDEYSVARSWKSAFSDYRHFLVCLAIISNFFGKFVNPPALAFKWAIFGKNRAKIDKFSTYLKINRLKRTPCRTILWFIAAAKSRVPPKLLHTVWVIFQDVATTYVCNGMISTPFQKRKYYW